MNPLPDLARLAEMRRLRVKGWSYWRIADHVGLSPERAAQLLKRDPMQARAYGLWVVFNDIPFLVTCRPNREARVKKYMREWKVRQKAIRAAEHDMMDAYWRCMVVQYRMEKGLSDG